MTAWTITNQPGFPLSTVMMLWNNLPDDVTSVEFFTAFVSIFMLAFDFFS